MDASIAANAVVVGVDTSAQAGRAARFAADTAARQGAPLVVAHGWANPLFVDIATKADVRAAHDHGAKVVADVLSELSLPVDMTVRTVLELDDPIHLLSTLSGDALCVVVGRHAHWAERLWDGETSTGVIKASTCPIISVPDRWRPRQGGHGRVVAVVDVDDTSRAVLDVAYAEADWRRADLVVLHATSTGPSDDGRRDVGREVAEIVSGFRADYPTVEARVETGFGTAAGLGGTWSQDADLVVVGRPHPVDHERPWVGSTTKRLLARTWCPLVVVPSTPVAL
ncbi:MAG: universal stress protein [Nocardioidaceae bacterium]|nr:universal stress protein [Nocardioidaceae bacterium]